MKKQECPNCSDWATEIVHTEMYSDSIEVVRVCICGAQYTNEYMLTNQEIDFIGE